MSKDIFLLMIVYEHIKLLFEKNSSIENCEELYDTRKVLFLRQRIDADRKRQEHLLPD